MADVSSTVDIPEAASVLVQGTELDANVNIASEMSLAEQLIGKSLYNSLSKAEKRRLYLALNRIIMFPIFPQQTAEIAIALRKFNEQYNIFNILTMLNLQGLEKGRPV